MAIGDRVIIVLTRETFYLTLVVGLVSIAIFLYDKVAPFEKGELMTSVGLIWVSLITKYFGYVGNSKFWKKVSDIFMFFALFLQGVIFLRLLLSGFFAIPNLPTS